MSENQPGLPAGYQFGVDGRVPHARYEAISLGKWGDCPTAVTRETFEQLFGTEDPSGQDYSLTFAADGVATVKDLQEINYEDSVFTPDGNGHYNLSNLCWVWICPTQQPED